MLYFNSKELENAVEMLEDAEKYLVSAEELFNELLNRSNHMNYMKISYTKLLI